MRVIFVRKDLQINRNFGTLIEVSHLMLSLGSVEILAR